MLFECKDFEKEIRTIKKLNQSLLKESEIISAMK